MTSVEPINGMVACLRAVDPRRRAEEDGIYADYEQLPEYIVLSVSQPGNGFDLKPGDRIICNSTGTRLNLGKDGVVYLFKRENIAGRIV